MPRFVVLTHDHPFLHWDLMLEEGDVLRTWRLKKQPDEQGPIRAEALGNHRLAYLDYEGPISGGRGTVERWDAGTYKTLESTGNRLVVRFAGKKLVGVAPFRRLAHVWTFWRLPLKTWDIVVEIPQLLTELIAEERWPATRAEAWKQQCQRESVVPEERVQSLAPDEKRICLSAPPFATVRESALDNPFWCEPASDPGGIDFDLAVPIGDFGIGSDAPILLDYRENLKDPRVIRLQWCGNGSRNKWVPMAEDFATFVHVLGL
jgi:hypothetical protein